MRVVKLFYCYAHEDSGYRDELEKHLASLKREGLFSDWSDQAILPGGVWEREIAEALETADVILLLVTVDFMNSDFIWNVELKRALERHDEGKAVVVPIIVCPTDWQHSVLGRLQARPKDGRSITEWENRDAAWVDVVRGLRELVKSQPSSSALPDGGGERFQLTPRMLVAQGEGELWNGLIQKASATLDAAVASPPQDLDDLLAQARALMLLGRAGEALAAFDRALALQSDQVEALIGRAETHLRLGQSKEALADIDRALAVEEKNPYGIYVRGQVYGAGGQARKAKKEYDRAIKLEPNHIPALVARGYLQGREGHHDRALRDFSQVLTLNPNVLGAIIGRGWAYLTLKRASEARAEFERALQLDPNNALALNGQKEARRLSETGRVSSILQHIFQ